MHGKWIVNLIQTRVARFLRHDGTLLHGLDGGLTSPLRNGLVTHLDGPFAESLTHRRLIFRVLLFPFLGFELGKFDLNGLLLSFFLR